ncbi:hypothetical protein CHS0354_021092 [Potamilus streckersoni]|nr:hypothetical protein CHS0354_021092 [Potamilus streckersoni]
MGNVDFVLECLLEMHRLDLIKKFGFDPNSVRQKAGQGLCLGPTPFRKLLFELAEDLSDDEVKRIKFVLKNEYLKRGNLQTLETAQELFIFLEKEGKLSVENVQVLYDIFKTIKREELVRQVDQYFRPDRRNTQMGPGPSKFQRVSSFPQTIQLMNGNTASNLQQNLGSQGGQVPGINRSSSAGTIELEESEQPQHPVFSDITLLKIAADMKDISYEDVYLELGLTQNEGLQYIGFNSMERVYRLLKYWRDVKMKDTPRQVLPGLKYICGRFGKKASLQHLDALVPDQQRTYVLQARTDQTPFVDQHDQLPYQRTQTLEQQGVQTLGPVQLEPHVLYGQMDLHDRFGQMGLQQTWKQTRLFNDFIIGSDQVRPGVHFEQVAPQQGMVWPQGNIGQGRSQVQEPVRSQENVEIRSQAQQPVSPRAGSEPYPQEQRQTGPQQMTPTPNVRNIDLETDFPCYKMDARPRGICLIISNKNFTVTAEDADSKEMPARQGTEKDTEYLNQIFTKLNFIVQIKEDLKDFEMARALVDIAQNTDHTRYDCFVCCILSHGALGHVFGSNGKLIPIRDLTSCVQANRCHTLAGKPKLFFIQACQGREKQEGTEIEADGPSVPEDLQMDSGGDMIPNEADFLLGYATVPGYVSFRSRTSGSWYIRKLVQMLDRYHDKIDLMSIMVKVNEEVSKADANVENGRYKQTPAPFVTLRKRLFFR